MLFRSPCDIAFRLIQTRWRLNAEEIVYVGDNAEKDFQGPEQLGMKTVLFRNREGLYYQKTDKGSDMGNRICVREITEIGSVIIDGI